MRRRSLSLIAVVLVGAACGRGPSSADIESAKAAGQPIIQKLADHKKIHGRYPTSLQEARISPVRTALGEFKYERRGETKDEYFVLSAGDFNRFGFVLLWNSEMAALGWIIEE